MLAARSLLCGTRAAPAGCRAAKRAHGNELVSQPCSPLPSTLQVLIDGVLRVPYSSMLRVNQVRPELQVVDPGDA